MSADIALTGLFYILLVTHS